ncbi:MAG: magnesium-translocating P-type ATPase [Alphaproteobacteria bacterium]|nr:magnesium-translocating P-type ATPase [Alphaproteobacteria bacterium]
MPNDSVPFWQKPVSDLFKELSAHSDGLTSEQSETFYKRYGSNSLETTHRRNALISFILLFRNPLVLLLLISAILVALVGEMKSALLISVITLTSTLIDFVQERKANQAAELLRKRVKARTLVFRDFKKQDIDTENLVPGDVVELSAGDLVPADGYVLEAKDFFIDQSSLSGESFPCEKSSTQNPTPTPQLTEASNAVAMGSSVISGWARVLICQTGSRTLLGSIAKTLDDEQFTNSFYISMQEFGMFLMRLTLTLVFIVLVINLYLGRPWLETFLFSIALGVGMTPEFLPMIVSVSLAHGGKRLAKQNVITKRLSSIYALGRMDVFCTDKTGTLTEAHLRLDQAINPHGKENERVFLLGYLNSYFESGFKSPIDAAILENKSIDVKAWKKIDEVPFDSSHRRISVLLDNEKERLFILKGPLEDILKTCQYIEDEITREIKELTQEEREKILSIFLSLSEQGFRVLGVAFKNVPQTHLHASREDEKGLVFSGFLSFFDKPCQDAGEAVRLLSKDGIQVKIITGDNEHVTKYLCKKLDITIQGLLTGEEIKLLTDQQLKILVQKTNLFCKVTPDQKGRIIRILQSNGHIVGFLGDGINDVSALHEADVGISVENAVDIAKEAANFILLERTLTVIHNGVLEGRRTFANILKYIMMGTSSNLGNMISMVGASFFLPFLPMLPVQILLNNLLYDLSEIAIPFDYVDAEQLDIPSKWSIAFIKKFMLALGPLSSLFDFCLFYILLSFFKADASFFQTGWFLGSLATQILVIFLIRTKRNPFKSRPHPYLIASSLGALAFGIFLPWSSFSSLFEFQALPFSFLITLFILVFLYLFIAGITKKFFYRKLQSL